MKKLEGKVAVITGGTSGIGLATAKLFHAEGAQVIVTGTNPATVERAREELRGIAAVVRSDSGNGADIASLFAGVVKDHGGLDVLFLNAGIVRSGTLVRVAHLDDLRQGGSAESLEQIFLSYFSEPKPKALNP